MSKKKTIWMPKPGREDYRAAQTYLGLVYRPATIKMLMRKLRRARTLEREAKDILRAANLPILAKDSPHVAADLKKIEKAKKLPPVLLIAGDGQHGIPLTIADGYHRVCASWYWDENTPVACCLVEFPRTRD
jgi:hypothetical protein